MKTIDDEEVFDYNARACGLTKGIFIELTKTESKITNSKKLLSVGSLIEGQISRSLKLNKPLSLKNTEDKKITGNVLRVFLIGMNTYMETDDSVYKIRFI